MKRFKRFLFRFLAVVLTLFFTGFIAVKLLIAPKKIVKNGSLKELTIEEKLEDFRYLYDTLKDSFPFFEVEKDKTGYDWLGSKQKFEEEIKATRNNEDFYYKLKGITMMIQNGHTGVVTPQRYNESFLPDYNNFFVYPWQQILAQKGVKDKYKDWNSIIKENPAVLPLKIRYIEGRYVVTEDYNKIEKGHILHSINGKTVDLYFKENLDKYYLNYDDKRSMVYVKSSMLNADPDKEYMITFLSKNGEMFTEALKSVKYEQPSAGTPSSSYSVEKILSESKVAYLKVTSMSNRTLEGDGKKIREFYNEIKNYPYLIIDIRGNGGGTDSYWRKNIVAPLISEKTRCSVAMAYKGDYIKPFYRSRGIFTKAISQLPSEFKNDYSLSMDRFTSSTISVTPNNSINYTGKIFLLVDDKVYSSSESFAAFCKGTGFAEVVGTTTGGDGIGIDPCVVALPNSGLVVRFSLDMGINPDGTVNEKTHTKPDIYAETSYEDFIKGEDSVLNKVLELCK